MKWKIGSCYGNLKTEVLDERGQCVAMVRTRLAGSRDETFSWPEGEANLNLIVTAPELLEMLKEATDCLEDMMAERGGWAWEEVLQESRILIAKAGGKS